MAIAFSDVQELASSADTPAPGASVTQFIPTDTDGEMLLLFTGGKPYDTDYEITSPTSTWTKAGSKADGTTANGNGTGSTRIACHYVESDGTLGNVTMNPISGALYSPMMRAGIGYTKDASKNWDIAVTFGADGTATGTGYSATMDDSIDIASGDTLVVCVVGPDDNATGLTGVSLTVPSCTVSSNTKRNTTTFSTTVGNDGIMEIHEFTVSAGTSSGVATFAATAVSGDSSGACVLVRLREVNANQTVAIGSGTETDSATGLTRRKTVALGTATEIDTAVAIAVGGGETVVALGAATETDSITGLTRRKSRAITAATETDALTGVSKRKTKALGVATETDIAVGIGDRKALGTATETDAAVAVGRRKSRSVTAASETDTLTGLGKRKTKALGAATETDSAVGLNRRRTIGTATESDSAVAVGRRKSRSVTAGTETDAATGLARRKVKALGAATETDTLTGLAKRKTKALGVGAETDTANGVAVRGGPLGSAAETDTAVGLTARKTKALGVASELTGGDRATEVESYETGNDGDAIGNTYGVFDGGSDTGSATWEVDTSRSVAGGKSALITVPAAGTTYRQITISGSNETLAHYRDYWYIPTVDVAGASVYLIQALRTSGTLVARLAFNSTQQLRMHDGITGVGDSLDFDDNSLYDQWVRVEWQLNQAAGTQTLRVFWGANLHGTSPDFASTAAFTDGSGVGQFRVGLTTATTNAFTYNRDATGWRLDDWCGPYASASPGVGKIKRKTLGAATETDTAVGVASGGPTVVALGTATESDALTGVSRRKVRSLGLATETGTPASLARVKRKALAFASETDTAVGLISPALTVALGTATETDTAGSVTATAVSHLWTFIPPASTKDIRYPLGRTPAGRLFPRVSGSPIRYCVLIFDADTFSRVVKTIRPTSAQMEAADFVYLGPRRYELSTSEAEVLIAAGYDVVDELNP